MKIDYADTTPGEGGNHNRRGVQSWNMSSVESYCKCGGKVDSVTSNKKPDLNSWTTIYIYICSIIRDNVTFECFRVLDYL